MKSGIRLDRYLLKRGSAGSIEKIKREIVTGWVKVNGETVREPSRVVTGKEEISVKRPGGIFASRGGEKLQHALNVFHISVKGRIVADLGASTGGFTDCLLHNGAVKVYSIDVGYGLLDYRLRNDHRVIVVERTNVRNLTKDAFNCKIDFLTTDLSFISILRVFDVIRNVFSPTKGIVLIKPQFEANPDEHCKGVVRNRENHKRILKRVIFSLVDLGMSFIAITYSPLKGPAGNIEFFLYYRIDEQVFPTKMSDNIELVINSIVDDAYKNLT